MVTKSIPISKTVGAKFFDEVDEEINFKQQNTWWNMIDKIVYFTLIFLLLNTLYLLSRIQKLERLETVNKLTLKIFANGYATLCKSFVQFCDILKNYENELHAKGVSNIRDQWGINGIRLRTKKQISRIFSF